MANSFEKLKELNLSCDEIERIGEALKKPEFRKLFCEYLKEVQDPNNRKLYEEEMTELEKERGNDITFIHPKPGYVIKTSVHGNQKAFINIAINEHVGKPTSSPAVEKGERGLQWSLPYSLSQPQEDFDKNRASCMVYDVTFHPDTIHLAKNSNAFRDTVNNTALDAVESNFGVILDKKNLKFPKLTYKGVPHASVIRKPSTHKPEHTPEEKAFYDELFAQADTNKSSVTGNNKVNQTSCDDDSEYTRPQFVIKQRSYVDMQECVEHKEAKINSTIPSELVVEIQLPLLKSSKNIKLDVTEKTIQLTCESPAKYKLNLTLPYHVNEASGSAEFRKDQKKMVITLPVEHTFAVDLSDSSANTDCIEGTEQFSEKQTTMNIPELEKLCLVEPQVESSEKCLKKSSEFRTNFLDENYHYDIPEFTCHVFNNTIAFTLNVKNVDVKSVGKLIIDGDTFHVKFTSISATFYPSHYAFCVKLPSYKIDNDNLSVEVWDNNVILQVPVCSTMNGSDDSITSYFYGLSSHSLIEKHVEDPAILNRMLDQRVEPPPTPSDSQQPQPKAEEPPERQPTSRSPRSEPEENTSARRKRRTRDSLRSETQSKATPAIDIVGATFCESSGDELSCSSFSFSPSKGILKRGSVRRCVSESGLDDYVSSSHENSFCGRDLAIPEDGEISSSLKKTVRFNDVINRQLYRSNSSILGQKRKNQRKAKNKKRGVERRLSESETSGDEKKEPVGKGCADSNQKEGDIFHLEVDN